MALIVYARINSNDGLPNRVSVAASYAIVALVNCAFACAMLRSSKVVSLSEPRESSSTIKRSPANAGLLFF